MSAPRPLIGVVVVSFNSDAFIDECLESLFASEGAALRVVVVDNQSTDNSCAAIRDWASGHVAFRRRTTSPLAPAPVVPKPIALDDLPANSPPTLSGPLTLLRSPLNGGFAYAVNLGLRWLLADPDIDLFWVLNPDCVVPPNTVAAIASAGHGGNFSLMGGRTIFYERPNEIQTDGGLVSRWTGRCTSLHSGLSPATTALPDAGEIDYITGASMVATREFIEISGLMDEAYFLYYEEVDWAFRRNALPLRISPAMVVYHRGGTSIGTGDTVRRASPFANYFNYRNRMRFVRRFIPFVGAIAIGHALAKAAQLLLKGAAEEAQAVLTGALSLPPPRAVRARIAEGASRTQAFGDCR